VFNWDLIGEKTTGFTNNFQHYFPKNPLKNTVIRPEIKIYPPSQFSL